MKSKICLFLLSSFILSCATKIPSMRSAEGHEKSRSPAEAEEIVKFGPTDNVSCRRPKSKLFAETTPIEVKLQGPYPFSGERGNRQNPIRESQLEVKTEAGQTRWIKHQVQGRGKSRAGFCKFNPLRLIWKKEEEGKRDGTAFAQLKGSDIKLVAHCLYDKGTIAENPKATQYVYGEYTLYKIVEALGLPIFSVRLAKVQYNNESGNPVVEGMGFFIEPNGSVADRCKLDHAQPTKYKGTISQADPRILIPYLFTRLITSTGDFYIEMGHNSESFFDSSGKSQLIVPYDFNDSSLVASRDFPYGLQEGNQAWIDRLKNGDLKHQRINAMNENLFGPVDSAQWKESFVKYAQLILSRKNQAFQAIEDSPLDNDKKPPFRDYLHQFFELVEKSLN